MTEQELAEAKQYAREDLICDLVDKAVDFTYLGIFAFLCARPLDSWLQVSLGMEPLGRHVFDPDLPPLLRVLSAVVLFRPYPRTQVQTQPANVRPVAMAVFKGRGTDTRLRSGHG